MTRDTSSLSNDEVKKLFEELFLHYKKDVISEQEMLTFFKEQGIRIATRKELVLLTGRIEHIVEWMEPGVGRGWAPTIFAKTHEDLEEFLKEHEDGPK